MTNIPQNQQKFKLTPTQIFLVFLSTYTLVAIIYNFSLDLLALLTAEIAYSLLLNKILNSSTKKIKGVENTLISTLIFLLVLHYTPTIPGIIVTIAGLTFLQIYKRLFYYHGNSILNPVLVGLFFTIIISYILQTFFAVSELALPFVSWWGASFGGYLSLILILVWLIIEVKQWHKNYILISFLLTYIIVTFATDGSELLMNSMMNSTIYFFAFIMLVEPRTSPALRNPEITYGIIAALAYTILRYAGVNNFELFALLIANLFNFGLRLKSLQFKPKAA